MSKKPVMVVEDDRDIADNLKELLDSEGYEVFLASNGKEGLNLLRQQNLTPGIILLDLMMPVMDGRAFLAEVDQDPTLKNKHIPVIVVSAAGDKFPEGTAGYMKKPLELEDLLAVVARYCNPSV